MLAQPPRCVRPGQTVAKPLERTVMAGFIPAMTFAIYNSVPRKISSATLK